MWKRFQSHGRDKEKQIGNPVLVETTYDEDQLRHIPNVSDAQNANYQPNYEYSHSPPNTNTYPPHDPRDYRASEVPTVSSVYSQPSPGLPSEHHPESYPQTGHGISPPSSPEPEDLQQNPNQPRRFRSMRDVSPVDESRARGSDGQRVASNIPVLRKAPANVRTNEPAHSAQKFWGGKVAPNSKVRWDTYSGEPTSSTAGRPGQVNPGTYAKTNLSPPSARRPMGYQVSVSAGQDVPRRNQSLMDRATRFGTKPPPVDTTLTKPREPWKGASGRAEIVQPIRDNPNPQKSSPIVPRKPGPKSGVSSPRDAQGSLAHASGRSPVTGDTPAVADVREEYDTHDNPIKPTVPLKIGRNSPPRSIASPTSPHDLGNQSLASPESLHSPASRTAYSHPTQITPTKNQPETRTEIDSEISRTDFAQEATRPAGTKIARKSIENSTGQDTGPASRFSWTTYNTSTTYQHSPPPSPPPPLPKSTPTIDQEPIPVAASILNRRRPVPSSDKTPTRKPIGSSSSSPPVTMDPSGPPSPRPLSTMSTNTQKALPRPPTEISAADHIDTLEAQMDDLRIRRSNVHRLLQDLYNAAPPNPLITDFRRMRLVDKRKKDFEDELAEIKREEHDVGLKLHRAWRKREKADPGSESALWVRRVTS